MTERPRSELSGASSDAELMEHVDGESSDPELAARIERDPDAKAKVEAIKQLGELVRGQLELAADAVAEAKFTAMWRRIDAQLEAKPLGRWARVTAWFDHYRGHMITGAFSAGAVAALALVLRPGASDGSEGGFAGRSGGAIDVRPVALRAAPEIDALDTPGETATVISLDDEDGHTAVIWLTPDDTVEGI
jgi:hypothetical protein